MACEPINELINCLNHFLDKDTGERFLEFPEEILHIVDLEHDGIHKGIEGVGFDTGLYAAELKTKRHYYRLKHAYDTNNNILAAHFNFYALCEKPKPLGAYFGEYGLCFFDKISRKILFNEAQYGIYCDGFLPIETKTHHSGLLISDLLQAEPVARLREELPDEFSDPVATLSKSYIPIGHGQFEAYAAILMPL